MKHIFHGAIFLLLLVPCTLAAQDQFVTQTFSAPLYLAPSFAGATDDARVFALYRNQWPRWPQSTSFFYISGDKQIDSWNTGLGASYVYAADTNGITLNKLTFSGSYRFTFSPNNPMSMLRLVPGVDIGLARATVDKERFSMLYPGVPVKNSLVYPDVSASLFAFIAEGFIGVSVQHITLPDQSLVADVRDPMPVKFTVVGAANVPLEAKYDASINPMFIYSQQGNFQLLTLGESFRKNHILGGIAYRNREAFIVMLGLHWERFRVCYTYDVPVDKAHQESGGAHEASLLIYPFGKAENNYFPSVETFGL